MTTPPHPSDVLHSGEVRDFRHAVALVIQQVERERLVETLFDNTEAGRRAAAALDAYGAAAETALTIYQNHVDAAERAAYAEMVATGDENLRLFAEALADGDYTRLAI